MALERLLATVALSTISVLALSGCVTIMPSALAPVAEGSVPQERDDDFGTVDVYTVLDDGTLDPAASGLGLRSGRRSRASPRSTSPPR